jgi:vancomycin resistance protein VanW
MGFGTTAMNQENLYRPPNRALPTWYLTLKGAVGAWYFRQKRHWKWLRAGRHLAAAQHAPLPVEVFAHATPLFRDLPQVDMYLQENKVTNLRLAAARVDGVVIPPGGCFSFWYCVGNPSARRGFLPGLVLRRGKVGVGVGGGLCQMGNLLHWMALHSPLRIAERHRHSYDVFPDQARTLPFGSGATLAWNYVDLQLHNHGDIPLQLAVWLSPTHLHGSIRAAAPLDTYYEVEEQNHLIRHEPWGGYSRHNQLLRHCRRKNDQSLLHSEIAVENHALMMYQPFLA